MSVLVDTSIWSALFRRQNPNSPEAIELQRLILAKAARIIGPIRQELLSGVRHAQQYVKLRDSLRQLPDLLLREQHFERAAEHCNLCMSRGVQRSPTDFLICAVAEIDTLFVYTADADFTYYARHLPIRLHR